MTSLFFFLRAMLARIAETITTSLLFIFPVFISFNGGMLLMALLRGDREIDTILWMLVYCGLGTFLGIANLIALMRIGPAPLASFPDRVIEAIFWMLRMRSR